MSRYNYNEEFLSLDGQMRLVCAVTHGVESRSETEIHPHIDSIEIYRFIEGASEFACEGHRIAISPGMLIAVCDNILHRPLTHAGARYERQRLLIKKEVFARYDTLRMDLYNRLRKKQILILPVTDGSEHVSQIFDAIQTMLARKTPYDDFCALMKALSLLIDMETGTSTAEQPLSCATAPETQRILAYINEHLDEELTYRRLAEQFYLSEKGLYQLFRREVGFPLAQYVANRRILCAMAVLHAGGSATEAAQSAGFHDYSVFYRTFLRHVGMTPRAYVKSRENVQI